MKRRLRHSYRALAALIEKTCSTGRHTSGVHIYIQTSIHTCEIKIKFKKSEIDRPACSVPLSQSVKLDRETISN